jgi:catechol 2,3-dioxygenase-like lactoylglutathione lyase family enzyme
VGGVHHLAVLARDVERVTAFYREVLGLRELQRHLHPDGTLRSTWLQLGEGPAFLAVEQATPGEPPGAQMSPGWFLLALSIPAAERTHWLDRLAARGVEVEKQSRWTVYFRDVEGNRVALSHHPDDPPVTERC